MATYGWNPKTGARELFASHDAREAAGFLDYHPNDKAKAPAAPAPVAKVKPAENEPPKVKVLTRAEIVQAFEEGGVEYDKEARVDALNAQLDAVLRSVIEKKTGEAPAADVPTRTLLETVRGK